MITRVQCARVVAFACLALVCMGCPIGPPGPPIPPDPVNPQLYTFEGTVNGVDDGAGAAAAAGVTALPPVTAITYRIVIDVGAGAYTIDNNNNVISLTDGVAYGNFPAGLDYFYAALFDGALINEVNGGRYNAGSDTKEFHICADGDPALQGQIIVGSNDHTLTIYRGDMQVKNWVAGTAGPSGTGTAVMSSEIAHDNGNGTTTVTCALLRLTSITPYP